jgi:sugar/nucleoside kinase (ribokinase family)
VTAPDYVIVGHIARDETLGGPKLGGTVSYAGFAASALGAQVGVVTSAAREESVLRLFPPAIQLHTVPSVTSTGFVNEYDGDNRRQVILGRAAPLALNHIPRGWRSAPIIHLGPLANEVDPALVNAFPGALVAVTPQGWMRAWNEQGIVYRKGWTDAEWVLPAAQVTVFSEEDIGRDAALEARYATLSPLLVVTRASKGCTLYRRGLPPLDIPAPTVNVADATGAGDVFTGTFLVLYQRDGDAVRACQRATYLASQSITRPGLEGTPRPDEIRAAMGLFTD